MKPKLLTILGPTATGKSDLAVRLSKEFNGEIISADSRQIYKGLDIGTGKITHDEMQGIPHYLLDIEEPQNRFSVMRWKELAERHIGDIHSRNKLPIICGGTGFYVASLLNGADLPLIDVDEEEQKKLEELDAPVLFDELQKLDPRRANEIDSKNKRRVARAILIARELGSVPEFKNVESKYDFLSIGISYPDDELKRRIKERLIKRIDFGMIDEAKKLHEAGLSFERMNELGLEYRYLAELLEGEINIEEFKQTLNTKIWQYARRQKTWFKKQENIHWFIPPVYENINDLVARWLKPKPKL